MIRAESREEAEGIAGSDPYTAAGFCTFELIEWELHQVMGAGPSDGSGTVLDGGDQGTGAVRPCHTGATAGRPYRAAAENVRRQAKARCSKRAMTPYSMISMRITNSSTHASTCSMSKFSNQKKNM